MPIPQHQQQSSNLKLVVFSQKTSFTMSKNAGVSLKNRGILGNHIDSAVSSDYFIVRKPLLLFDLNKI